MPSSLALLSTGADRPRMPTAEDEARAIHQFTRLQILMEDWDDVIEEWLEEHITEERAAIWGIPDTSANSIADLCRQLSVPGLYGHRPQVDRADGGLEGYADEGGLLDEAGYFTKMAFVQYLTLGLGDMFTRFHVTRGQRFSVRVVWPHNIHLVGDVEDPGCPVQLWELRRRLLLPENVWVYTWEVFDLGAYAADGTMSKPASYRIYRAKAGSPSTVPLGSDGYQSGGLGEDLSARFITHADGTTGAMVGEQYPWVGDDGVPCFPYGRYQSEDTGQLWNTFLKRGAHRGALNNALYWTYTGHVARDATGSYVVIAGLTPSGHEVREPQRVGEKPIYSKLIEPGTMEYHDAIEGQTPFVHEVGASENLPALLDFSERYEMRQAVRWGLNPSDLSKSANPASAAALMVSNEGKREYSAQVQPVFRRSDLAAIRIGAIVLAAAGLGVYPQTGYSIQYREIPKSPQELRETREQLEWERSQGMRSRVGVYQALHRGVTAEDALVALVRIAKQERELEAAIQALAKDDDGVEAAVESPLVGIVSTVKDIVAAVAAGEVPRDAGVAQVARAYRISLDEAELLVGSAGLDFVPTPKDGAPVIDDARPDDTDTDTDEE